MATYFYERDKCDSFDSQRLETSAYGKLPRAGNLEILGRSGSGSMALWQLILWFGIGRDYGWQFLLQTMAIK